MAVRECCPFHPDEDVAGVFLSAEVGWSFGCSRSGHVPPGPYTWLRPPEPQNPEELTGIAADLGPDVAIPHALQSTRGTWIEYGLVERAYALESPEDWQFLVDRYGHTALRQNRHGEGGYTVSAFLGGVLARLGRQETIAFRLGPATGRWKYNEKTGYYALFPAPPADKLLSWEDSGATVEYVAGQIEV